MSPKIAGLLVILSGVLMFQQSDYKIEYEHMDLHRFNEEYCENMNIKTFKYNRTKAVSNGTFTFKKNLGNDVQVLVQGYKFMSNEYRFFPIHFQFDFCNCLVKNEFGLGEFLTCGNFSKCPIKKGRYHICHWAPEESRFPPYIPDGKYMMDLGILHKGVEVMVLRFYGRVYRPFVFN